MRKHLTAASLLACLTSMPVFSQEGGQITGTVTDKSGAVVVNLTVKAIEVKTGFSRSVVSGSDGLYFLTGLRPAEYEVVAENTGFRTFRRPGVELLANQSLTLNIVLEVGAVTETVTVAGAVVQVNTTTSTLGDVADHARIVDLVLNGRDIAKLASVVAGMNVISVSAESGKSIPGGLQLSSNGTRNQQISYRLDGASNTDSYFQENQTFPFPDAVQESSIQTSNYSASQGSNSGAIVNVVTRSGTNSLHGGGLNSYAIASSTRATPSHRPAISSSATSSASTAADLF